MYGHILEIVNNIEAQIQLVWLEPRIRSYIAHTLMLIRQTVYDRNDIDQQLRLHIHRLLDHIPKTNLPPQLVEHLNILICSVLDTDTDVDIISPRLAQLILSD